MESVTISDFRLNLSAYIAVAVKEPVMITEDSSKQRAVLVSPELYERAMQALKACEESEAMEVNQGDSTPIPMNNLFDNLGI